MPVIDLNKIKTEKDRTFVEKAKDMGRKVKEKVEDGVHWAMQNPREAAGLLAGAGALVAGAGKVVRGVNRHATARQERYNQERYVYDHSMRAYLKLKRPLRNNDIVRIDEERRRTGKKMSEVLADMGLLE